MTFLPQMEGAPAPALRPLPGVTVDAEEAGGHGRGPADRAPWPPGGPDVVLVTEGTYPHAHGGVSVWCDQLVTGLPELSFAVVALTAFGYQRPVYDLPGNVARLETVGLWDARPPRPAHRRRPASLAAFVAALLTEPDDDVTGFVQLVYELAAHSDRDVARELTFAELLAALDAELASPRWADLAGVRASDLVQVAEMLDHLLRPAAVDPGPAPVYHASSNGLAALVCMRARRRHGGRFLLTEHGIYLRERYLELRRTPMARPAKALLLRFHRLVSAAAYAEAAVVAPGSRWNQRWEARYGAPPGRLRTIYNGVDPGAFPASRGADAGPRAGPDSGPVVAWLGRIDPIKDLETLIRAFAVVHRAQPVARLRLYGRTPAANAGYRAELDGLVDELGLGGTVTFEGGVPASADAYRDADVAVLSSISEGFPYSLIEAMACGVPAVATGVGGVPEAVADAGVVVAPRAVEPLGRALVELLDDEARRRSLGARARARVVEHFTLAQCIDDYRDLFDDLRDGGPRHLQVVGRAGGAPGGDGVSPARAAPARPLTPAEHDALVVAVGGADAVATAVDADELAATLESVGVTDAVAVDRFDALDVFDLAERTWDRVRAAGRPDAAPRRPPPAPRPVRGALARGVAYVLPAVAVAAASLGGAPQAALVAASALGWGLAQGGGVLAYTTLHRTPTPTVLAPLRRGLLAAAGAVGAAAAVVAGVGGGPADGLAFALPLLHMIGATALVMAGRTRRLLAALAPVSLLSVAALVRPGTVLPGLVGPASVVTVAVTLGLVAVAARRAPPAGRLLEATDWLRALPLVACGWATAGLALLAVSALSGLPGLDETDARQWLALGLPLWTMVAGCEWLLLRLQGALRAGLEASPTLPAFRSAARWTVALWLGSALLVLELTVLVASLVADVPPLTALTGAVMFFLVAVALAGVTVLTVAGRTVRAAAAVGVAVVVLARAATTPGTPGGPADHLVALVVCGVVAGGLLVAAARALVDPASQR